MLLPYRRWQGDGVGVGPDIVYVCSPIAYGDRTCVPAFRVGNDASVHACEQPTWYFDQLDLSSYHLSQQLNYGGVVGRRRGGTSHELDKQHFATEMKVVGTGGWGSAA